MPTADNTPTSAPHSPHSFGDGESHGHGSPADARSAELERVLGDGSHDDDDDDNDNGGSEEEEEEEDDEVVDNAPPGVDPAALIPARDLRDGDEFFVVADFPTSVPVSALTGASFVGLETDAPIARLRDGRCFQGQFRESVGSHVVFSSHLPRRVDNVVVGATHHELVFNPVAVCRKRKAGD